MTYLIGYAAILFFVWCLCLTNKKKDPKPSTNNLKREK